MKAANVFSPIGTVTVTVKKDPFPSKYSASNVPEIEAQLEDEANSDLLFSANKWLTLRFASLVSILFFIIITPVIDSDIVSL